MKKYKDEIYDLQLKIHGQFATIEHNNIIGLFSEELKKEGIDYDKYVDAYVKLTDYYLKGYEENKEASDNEFLKKVLADMKRIMEVADMISE